MVYIVRSRGYSLGLDRKTTTIRICAVIVMTHAVLTFARCSNCAANKCTTRGECLEGCVPGFVDISCQEKCPPNCMNNTCHLDRQKGTYVCSDGCQDGYCGSTCKLTCQKGCTTCDRASCTVCDVKPCVGDRYGEECTPCSTNFEKCDKDTGKCIKCKKGFYGESCETRCPPCLSVHNDRLSGCQTGCNICHDVSLQDHLTQELIVSNDFRSIIVLFVVTLAVLIMLCILGVLQCWRIQKLQKIVSLRARLELEGGDGEKRIESSYVSVATSP